MEYSYNGILFWPQKEGIAFTCDYTDEFWEHYAKGNKSDRERQIQNNYTYMRILEN